MPINPDTPYDNDMAMGGTGCVVYLPEGKNITREELQKELCAAQRNADFAACQELKECGCGRLFEIRLPFLEDASRLRISVQCSYCNKYTDAIITGDINEVYGYLARMLYALRQPPSQGPLITVRANTVHPRPLTTDERAKRDDDWPGFEGL